MKLKDEILALKDQGSQEYDLKHYKQEIGYDSEQWVAGLWSKVLEKFVAKRTGRAGVSASELRLRSERYTWVLHLCLIHHCQMCSSHPSIFTRCTTFKLRQTFIREHISTERKSPGFINTLVETSRLLSLNVDDKLEPSNSLLKDWHLILSILELSNFHNLRLSDIVQTFVSNGHTPVSIEPVIDLERCRPSNI
jgi:hypothetical protein